MKSSYELTVPGPAAAVWAALADVDRVLGALGSATSGANLTRAAGGLTGSLRCRFGNTQVTYRLTVEGTGADTDSRSGGLAVTGVEARGDGTLDATVTVTVDPDGDDATIRVVAEIEVSGRAEGVDVDQWSRVLGHLLVAALPAAPAEAAESALVPQPRDPEPDLQVHRTTPAPAAPRPSPAVVPAPRSAVRDRRPLVAVGVALVLLLAVRRARRRHRRR